MSKFHRPRLVFTCLLLPFGLIASTASAENWPNWRGPHNNGISSETNIPAEWDGTKNVAWKIKLPGPAGATPVVWDDNIFLTSVKGEELVLMCIGADGQERWQRVVGKGNQDVRGDEGNSASPSPVTDGKYVWTLMGSGDLACFDFSGKEIWKFNVEDRYGKLNLQFGLTSTPVVDGGRLFLQLIHGDGEVTTREAQVVALEAATGKEIWKRKRDSDAIAECEHSYASPIIYDDGKQKYLVTHGADYAVAHSLDTGEELWRCGGLNPKEATPGKRYNPTLRFVASPAAVPGLIVVPSAKNGPVLGLRPDSQGDVTGSDSAHIWIRGDNTPDVPSPLIVDGLVYLCRENGNLLCLEADTGKELYNKATVRTRHRASPVYADGKVYLVSRDGNVTVVKAGPEFEKLAQNDLGESQSSSPVISGGTIYLRTYDSLWAIRATN